MRLAVIISLVGLVVAIAAIFVSYYQVQFYKKILEENNNNTNETN